MLRNAEGNKVKWRCIHREHCSVNLFTSGDYIVYAPEHKHNPDNVSCVARIFKTHYKMQLNYQPKGDQSKLYNQEYKALKELLGDKAMAGISKFNSMKHLRKTCISDDFKKLRAICPTAFMSYCDIPWHDVFADDEDVKTHKSNIEDLKNVMCTSCGKILSTGRNMRHHRESCGMESKVIYHSMKAFKMLRDGIYSILFGKGGENTIYLRLNYYLYFLKIYF